MGWDETTQKARKAPRQQELFVEMSDTEQKIADALSKESKAMHIDELAIETTIPMHELSSILFEMEIKGIISSQPGNMFRLS